ncbi:MAG: dienelactone hydrolase family protein [Dehalococcoidia bacterium]|nr:dienelactone hydrolase family protein [Dehalococcoidia bacterium]
MPRLHCPHRAQSRPSPSPPRRPAMCYTSKSHPPIPVISGAAVDTASVTLTSRDGTKFSAYTAMPAGNARVGMIVLPDVRGLHSFYMELADRFAERGIAAVAIDYFGRTAGLGPRTDDFSWQEHVAQTKVPQIAQDVAAAAARLRYDNPQRKLFTVGFCFGGSSSWFQGMENHGLSGVIGFYGQPTANARDGSPSPAARAAQLRAPLLALMAGDDPHIPVTEVEKFRAALTAAGKQHAIHIYANAPHSFFDRTAKEHAAASADAWEKVLAFIKQNS